MLDVSFADLFIFNFNFFLMLSPTKALCFQVVLLFVIGFWLYSNLRTVERISVKLCTSMYDDEKMN